MIRTHLRWQDVRPEDLRGHCAIVIDVLRWSTVVAQALENGATCVEAYATPEAALARATEIGRLNSVLGGERGNVALPGFDVGNSPAEYSRDRVWDRVVVTTTTNGTQGLVAARLAERVLVGSFVNLEAVANAAAKALDEGLPVALVACGQGGLTAEEDTACAGAIAMALGAHVLDAATERACAEWARIGRDPVLAMMRSPHAARLREAGFADDVDFAARLDELRVVPRVSSGTRIDTSEAPVRRSGPVYL